MVKLTISKIFRKDRFQESRIPLPTRLLLRFCQFPSNYYTSKFKTSTLCTFATIKRLAQINHKINIKTNGNGINQGWNNKNLLIRLTRINDYFEKKINFTIDKKGPKIVRASLIKRMPG